MYQKKSTTLRSEKIYLQPQTSHASHGRYPVFPPLPVRYGSLKFPVVFTLVALAGVLFVNCTPPPPVLQKCPEPLWKAYSQFNSFQVKEETARLEALLAAGDTTCLDSGALTDSTDTTAANKLSALEVKRRLFELSIHRANPEYDLDRIFDYVSFLYQHGAPDSLRYLNWGRVVRERKALLKERDSLETVVADITEGEKKESRSLKKLQQEKKVYLKQRDSLTAVISAQQETISKLQKLDVMMEQQRSKIQ